MVICTACTMQGGSTSNYALGSTDAEHERLIRQGVILAPLTERLFREAGIGPGQRVLDVGSGMGDVAIIAARLVGHSGEVVGIERDSRSIARARSRVANADVHNVSFLEADLSQPKSAGPFDAAVGRLILQFVPDPVVALHHLTQLVRPGGVVAFQEVSYAPLLALSTHIPLWSACVSAAREAILRSGANPEIGVALHRNFQKGPDFCAQEAQYAEKCAFHAGLSRYPLLGSISSCGRSRAGDGQTGS